MPPGYGRDLAHLHDVGFDLLAKHAAPAIVKQLHAAGFDQGTVMELGCGSGITSRYLSDAGFEVIGLDLSESMITLARRRVPEADFQIGSFVTVEIPTCVAVTGVGEIFGYQFDSENTQAARADLFYRIFKALVPGGQLIFDMAASDRAPIPSPAKTYFEGDDWICLVESDVDEEKRRLTRDIISLRREGDFYRRSHEVHQLELIEPDDIVRSLERIGFAVSVSRVYGQFSLPKGLYAFFATKPR